MNDSYKRMKDHLLSDTIPVNGRDLYEPIPRKSSLTRPKSEPSFYIDQQSNNHQRNAYHPSYSDPHDHTDHLIDTVLEVPTKCVEQAKEVGKRVVQYVGDHSHLHSGTVKKRVLNGPTLSNAFRTHSEFVFIRSFVSDAFHNRSSRRESVPMTTNVATNAHSEYVPARSDLLVPNAFFNRSPQPEWMTPNCLLDNKFLISGHRPPMPSFKQCFASIFHLHTETVNIWTHLLGTLFFIITTIYFISRPSNEVHIEQKLIFGAFFLGTIICLLCSTLYHTFYCHSPQVSRFLSKLDYCGIAILIVGSDIPLLYYQFHCEFGTKVAYLTLIALLGIGCMVVSMWDKFSSPQYRIYRALLFITFGIFGLIPTYHYIIRFGIKHALTTGGTQYLVIVVALYATGACLYAARIPERLAPGLFDIWFQSHQLFHVFVVAAACIHYYGICLLSYNQTHLFGNCRNILISNTTAMSSMIS